MFGRIALPNARKLDDMTDAEISRRFRALFDLTRDEVDPPWGLSRDTWERIERGETVPKLGVPVVVDEIRRLMQMIDEIVPEAARRAWAVSAVGPTR